jgi:hypothetical protein
MRGFGGASQVVAPLSNNTEPAEGHGFGEDIHIAGTCTLPTEASLPDTVSSLVTGHAHKAGGVVHQAREDGIHHGVGRSELGHHTPTSSPGIYTTSPRLNSRCHTVRSSQSSSASRRASVMSTKIGSRMHSPPPTEKGIIITHGADPLKCIAQSYMYM